MDQIEPALTGSGAPSKASPRVVPATDEPAGAGDLPPALLTAMLAANRLLALEAGRGLPGGGLTTAQFRILSFLLGQPGASLSDVAAHLGTRLSTTSIMLTKLATCGHVDRARDPASRRRVRLVLTPKGERSILAARRALFARIGRAVRQLPAEDAAVLAAALPALHRLFALL